MKMHARGANAEMSIHPSPSVIDANHIMDEFRRTAVIILEHDGSLLCHNPLDEPAELSQGMIELPADQVLGSEASHLVERIVAFAFDVLGLQTLDLRIREDLTGRDQPTNQAEE